MPKDNTEILEKALDVYLDDVASFILTRSQENIVKNGTSDTGLLLTSANINSEFLKKQIVYPTPYATYVEFGTQPHAVSEKGRKAIADWAKRKLALNEVEADKASWGIVNKIKVEGTEPQPFLRPALDEFRLRGLPK